MQHTHTPGPWHLAGDAEGTMITASKGAQIAMWPPQGGTVEQCANARLIAAAPDLLAALQLALDQLSALSFADDRIVYARERARAAIAQAEGDA